MSESTPPTPTPTPTPASHPGVRIQGNVGRGSLTGSDPPPDQAYPPIPHNSQRPQRLPRLLILETLYYHPPDEDPLQVNGNGVRWLVSREQPYVRKMGLTQQWQPLAQGSWLTECGHLILRNDQPVPNHSPLPEEKALLEEQVIEVAVLLPDDEQGRDMFSPPKPRGQAIICWLVGPGDSLRGTPAEVDHLIVRARSGTVRCTLTLIPS